MTKTTNEAVDRKDDSACVVDRDKTVPEQLEALQADMDQYLQKLQDSFTQAQASVLAKKKLCALLPLDLPLAPTGIRVTNSVYKADAEMSFDGASRLQVLALFEHLPGVDVLLVAGGTSAFVPEERFTPNAPRNDKVTSVGPLVYRLSAWMQDLQEEYFWWTRLGDKLVRVSAKSSVKNSAHTLNRNPAQLAATARSRKVSSELTATTWEYSGLPEGLVTRWHGGSNFTAVPLTVHVTRETPVKEAFSRTMATTAFVSTRCDCTC